MNLSKTPETSGTPLLQKANTLLHRIAQTIGDYLNDPRNFDYKLASHGRSLQGLEKQGLINEDHLPQANEAYIPHA